MFCPNCRNELPEWATICNNCGCKVSSVDIIATDEDANQRFNKVKLIIIAVAVVVVLAVLISSIVVLVNNKEDEAPTETVSINVPSTTESVSSSQMLDENAPMVVYFKEATDGYFRKCVVYRDGDNTLSLEQSKGAYSSRINGGEDFSQEEREKWIKDYTKAFKNEELDERYVKTEVFASANEIRATVIVPNLQDEKSQEYLEEMKLLTGYKVGMTYSELDTLLKRSGYRRTQ